MATLSPTGFNYRYSQTAGDPTRNIFQEYDWDPLFPGWANDLCTAGYGPVSGPAASLMPGYIRPAFVTEAGTQISDNQAYWGVVQSFSYTDTNGVKHTDVATYPASGAQANTSVKAKVITDPNAVYAVQVNTTGTPISQNSLLGAAAFLYLPTPLPNVYVTQITTEYRNGSDVALGSLTGGIFNKNLSSQSITIVNYSTFVGSANMAFFESLFCCIVLGLDPQTKINFTQEQEAGSTINPTVLVRLANMLGDYNAIVA